MNNNYKAFTITVPERYKSVNIVTKEMSKHGIRHKLYVDKEHKGQPWNFTRMLYDICTKEGHGANVITTTDDILLSEGWHDIVSNILKNTDYDVITLFTNRKYEADDVFGIKKASQNWWLYDVFVVYREGVLNEAFFYEFLNFCKRKDVHKKEKKHYDNMLSHFLYINGYKCGIVRPNYVELQNVKSVLGHNIRDCSKERGETIG